MPLHYKGIIGPIHTRQREWLYPWCVCDLPSSDNVAALAAAWRFCSSSTWSCQGVHQGASSSPTGCFWFLQVVLHTGAWLGPGAVAGSGSPVTVQKFVSSLISFTISFPGPPFYVPESEVKSLFGKSRFSSPLGCFPKYKNGFVCFCLCSEWPSCVFAT